MEEILITSSTMLANTYYIFRENGVQVKFTVDNDKILSDRTLRTKEQNYIYNNIIGATKRKENLRININ